MQVLSIQIGPAKPIIIGGRRVMTAISKTPVSGRVRVKPLGLEGDEQADRSVHGGLQKAVYAYPSEHYGYWREEALRAGNEATLPYGSMGENLSLAGLLETEVCVGDELRFPDCLLRITQPRRPCFKLNTILNDRLAGKKMAQTEFSGFYLSVVEEGTIAAGETFELLPGAREVKISALAAVSKLKTRND